MHQLHLSKSISDWATELKLINLFIFYESKTS